MTISSIGPQYTTMFRDIARAALKSGRYKRLVVPGCGTFHLVHQAQQAGWKPAQIECSDISLLSGLMGYHVNNKPLDDLHIRIQGMDDEPMHDAPTVAFLQLMARYQAKGDVYFWEQVLLDMAARRDQYIARIRTQFDRARVLFAGVDYRLQDFWAHLAEVLDDPETVVLFNPPCSPAGYEKFYDDKGRITWNQPAFRPFDMEREMSEMASVLQQGRALCAVLEEAEPGRPSMPAVYAMASTRRSPDDPTGVRTMNSYVSSNRLDELEDLLTRRFANRKPGAAAVPAKYHLLPQGYEMKADSHVSLVLLDAAEGLYYRLLWTHTFLPGPGQASDWAVLVDGFLAAVFGYNETFMAIGRPGCEDVMHAHYGIGIPGHPRRLTRLINRLMLCREVINQVVDPLLAPKVARLRTAQIAKHSESKDKRGMMVLTKRTERKDGHGFILSYEADIIEESLNEAFAWWLKDEEHYWSTRRGSHKPSGHKGVQRPSVSNSAGLVSIEGPRSAARLAGASAKRR